jgi:hypothetical protein
MLSPPTGYNTMLRMTRMLPNELLLHVIKEWTIFAEDFLMDEHWYQKEGKQVTAEGETLQEVLNHSYEILRHRQ